MKSLFKENFDKLMMFLVFIVLLGCYLVFMPDNTLATLCRDAFLVLTALLGFRRHNAPTVNAENIETIETGDISNNEPEQEKPTVNFIG